MNQPTEFAIGVIAACSFVGIIFMATIKELLEDIKAILKTIQTTVNKK